MKCHDCNGAELVTEKRDHHYIECGLPNVYLRGIDVDVCVRCGAEFIEIQSMGELHRVLTADLIKAQQRLSGEEIRFLRKSLGWGADDFAKNIGVEEETVREWESGDTEMSLNQEAWLRISVAVREPKTDYKPELISAPHRQRTLTARRAEMPPWMIEANSGGFFAA